MDMLEQAQCLRKRLRIAFVTETYPPEINGVSLSTARFIRGLRKRNHAIELVRPRQQREAHDADAHAGDIDEVLVPGVPIPRYPDLRMGLPAKRLLARRWARNPPDLVHIVTEGPLGWSALRAAEESCLPVTSDFRTNFDAYSRHYGAGWLQKPVLAYLKQFHNRTRRTLVPTEQQRQKLASAGFSNLEIVARGVDTQLFNPARRSESLRRSWGAGPDDIVVMHVGRLAPEKNLRLLSATLRVVQARNAATRVVVVGDGPARGFLQQAHPRAIFAGTRSGEELAAHYASGDLFVFPSLTETFGNVTLEAMASGVAVLAFDYAAAAKHIRHGTNGYLVPYGDEPAFYRLAADIAANTSALRESGKAARHAAAQLDWDRVVRELETLFMAVVETENVSRIETGPRVSWTPAQT